MYVEPIKGNETYNIAYRDLKMNSPGSPQNWEGNIKGFIILRFLLIILVILQIFSNILNIITSGLLFSFSCSVDSYFSFSFLRCGENDLGKKIVNWMKTWFDDLFINLVLTIHHICTKKSSFLSLKTLTDKKDKAATKILFNIRCIIIILKL